MKRKFTRYPKSFIKAAATLPPHVQKLTVDEAIQDWGCNADDILNWYEIPVSNIGYFYVNPNYTDDEVTGIETKSGEYFIAFGGRGAEILEYSSLSEMLNEIEQKTFTAYQDR